MIFFREKGTANETGLLEMIEKTKGGKMYEVGSAFGESAVLFAPHFDEVHCVDKWDNSSADREKRFDEATKDVKNIFKHKGYASEEVKNIPDASLDFVYIDATHTHPALLEDIKLWKPKIKSGGFIGGHDYNYKFMGVIRAVHENFDRPDWVFMDSSWLKCV